MFSEAYHHLHHSLSHIAATRKRHHFVSPATAEVTQICSSCLRAPRVGKWGMCAQINLFNKVFLIVFIQKIKLHILHISCKAQKHYFIYPI